MFLITGSREESLPSKNIMNMGAVGWSLRGSIFQTPLGFRAMGPRASSPLPPHSQGQLSVLSWAVFPSHPGRPALPAAVSGQVATVGIFALDSPQLAEWAVRSDNTGSSHCLYPSWLVEALGLFDL